MKKYYNLFNYSILMVALQGGCLSNSDNDNPQYYYPDRNKDINKSLTSNSETAYSVQQELYFKNRLDEVNEKYTQSQRLVESLEEQSLIDKKVKKDMQTLLEQATQQLENEIEKSNDVIKKGKEHIYDQEKSIKDLREQIANKDVEITEFKTRLIDYKQATENKDQEIEKLRAELEKMKQEIAKSKNSNYINDKIKNLKILSDNFTVESVDADKFTITDGDKKYNAKLYNDDDFDYAWYKTNIANKSKYETDHVKVVFPLFIDNKTKDDFIINELKQILIITPFVEKELMIARDGSSSKYPDFNDESELNETFKKIIAFFVDLQDVPDYLLAKDIYIDKDKKINIYKWKKHPNIVKNSILSKIAILLNQVYNECYQQNINSNIKKSLFDQLSYLVEQVVLEKKK